MANNTRRIVTGHDANGKAIIQHDTAAPVFLPANRPGVEVTNLWLTTETLANLADTTDRAQGQVALTPPSHGRDLRVP